jgi:hypothetical protein
MLTGTPKFEIEREDWTSFRTVESAASRRAVAAMAAPLTRPRPGRAEQPAHVKTAWAYFGFGASPR